MMIMDDLSSCYLLGKMAKEENRKVKEVFGFLFL
jgi:hypothetical protein